MRVFNTYPKPSTYDGNIAKVCSVHLEDTLQSEFDFTVVLSDRNCTSNLYGPGFDRCTC